MHDRLALDLFPDKVIEVACDRCRRSDKYAVAALAAVYGPDVPLALLRRHVAGSCTAMRRRGQQACGVYFPDLLVQAEAAE
jgi:hypothetical protein